MERHGVAYSAACWTPSGLQDLATMLETEGSRHLLSLSRSRLESVWQETVAAFLDPSSLERRTLDTALQRFCRLSPVGLARGLDVVLRGVGGSAAAELLRTATPAADRRPVLVALASNLPALAVQPLLPALAVRRPVILKSPSSEPLFAPAFVRALVAREPHLAAAVAALTWKGGEAALEAPLLTAAGTVLAYGEAASIADLEARAPGKVVGYGPKTSLAAIGGSVSPADVAPGLSLDVALFDQRGCLSVQAVYTAGDPRRLADEVARALTALAREIPPGPAPPEVAAGVHQIRSEAEMRGLYRPEIPMAAGSVVVEAIPDFRPSPGLRTVRVHGLDSLDGLPAILGPWHGRLQGAALAGAGALALAPALENLGISRCAPPGDLQQADALWHNGGEHPLRALAAGRPSGG